MICRFCQNEVNDLIIDLGVMAPSNSYVLKKNLKKKHNVYPLKVYVCRKCWLVQTEDFAKKEEFFSDNYAYFSSTSKTWTEHARKFSEMIIEKEKLNTSSYVIEIASNDGYLLKNFKKLNINCLGIEPTTSTAKKAEQLGIVVEKIFLTEKSANEIIKKYQKADLIVGNNVYAHVPDINDFTKAIEILLKEEGVLTLEFPHLLNLIKFNQFDTIYHEHFSYFSLLTVERIFEANGLKVFDVEELNTHGGSIRVYGCKKNSKRKKTNRYEKIRQKTINSDLENIVTYSNFNHKAEEIKKKLVKILKEIKINKKIVVGYGAAAKGNTLLNYCNIKSDLVKAVVDGAESKQNTFLPTSHIPVYSPDFLIDNKVDYILILPWNLKDEILEKIKFITSKGTKVIKPIPNVQIL